MVLFGGVCVVLFGGRAWFYSGGHAWFYSGGHVWFYSGACVVLFGGHAWFYLGGCAWFYSGGHAWFYLGGACMVLFGGHAWFYLGGCAWFYSGGMLGFIWGGMRGFIWGACVVFSVFSDTMRYGQWAGGTHPTGMHSCWFTEICCSDVNCVQNLLDLCSVIASSDVTRWSMHSVIQHVMEHTYLRRSTQILGSKRIVTYSWSYHSDSGSRDIDLAFRDIELGPCVIDFGSRTSACFPWLNGCLDYRMLVSTYGLTFFFSAADFFPRTAKFNLQIFYAEDGRKRQVR